MNEKPVIKVITSTRMARTFGILLVVALLVLTLLSLLEEPSPMMESHGYAAMFTCITIFSTIIFGIFLLIAWRREIIGGIIYLAVAGLLLVALIYVITINFQDAKPLFEIFLLWGPVILFTSFTLITGVLFLVSGRRKKHQIK